MREIYKQMVDASTPGRLEGEGPMTAYLYERLMQGDMGDEECIFAGDESLIRYGKRILHFASQGFISLWAYETVAEAEQVIADICEDE